MLRLNKVGKLRKAYTKLREKSKKIIEDYKTYWDRDRTTYNYERTFFIKINKALKENDPNFLQWIQWTIKNLSKINFSANYKTSIVDNKQIVNAIIFDMRQSKKYDLKLKKFVSILLNYNDLFAIEIEKGKFCEFCGAELREGSRYCQKCGSPTGLMPVEIEEEKVRIKKKRKKEPIWEKGKAGAEPIWKEKGTGAEPIWEKGKAFEPIWEKGQTEKIWKESGEGFESIWKEKGTGFESIWKDKLPYQPSQELIKQTQKKASIKLENVIDVNLDGSLTLQIDYKAEKIKVLMLINISNPRILKLDLQLLDALKNFIEMMVQNLQFVLYSEFTDFEVARVLQKIDEMQLESDLNRELVEVIKTADLTEENGIIVSEEVQIIQNEIEDLPQSNIRSDLLEIVDIINNTEDPLLRQEFLGSLKDRIESQNLLELKRKHFQDKEIEKEIDELLKRTNKISDEQNRQEIIDLLNSINQLEEYEKQKKIIEKIKKLIIKFEEK